MGFEVDDVRTWAAEIRTASGQIGARAATALRKTVADVERDAKINAPVDTGFLRSSIESTTSGSGAHGSMTGLVGVGASYAIYVELGTSRMGAQPFFFPAVDRHGPIFLDALTQIRDSL